MKLPIVAIVGRPNVGKSSLFNMLANRRISIVDPTAGVTRDRVSTPVSIYDRHVELCDTGGMGIQDIDNLTADVERQIQYAIEAAAVVLFVVDIRDGVVPLDQLVGERLRVLNKPIIFVANKADDPKHDFNVGEFYRLGYGEPICVSADQKRGKEELFDAITAKLPPEDEVASPNIVELKVAIVGRRNVGKSTFINSLAQDDRVIVSEVAGTTRDSVDVRFERDGKTFIAIDTAGVRKKSSTGTNVEFYSLHRAERSIRRADVVLMFFDPTVKVSRVDKQLAEYVLENHKPCIFVVNKWDLAKDRIHTGKWADYLRKVFPMLDYVPIAFITAQNGKNVYRLLNLAQELFKQAGRRAKTGELNRAIRAALAANVPPMRQNRVPKVYYATQVATNPPTVVIVTNGPDLFDETYVRYLTKTLRDTFPYPEVPVRVMLKTKSDASARGESMANAMAGEEVEQEVFMTPTDYDADAAETFPDEPPLEPAGVEVEVDEEAFDPAEIADVDMDDAEDEADGELEDEGDGELEDEGEVEVENDEVVIEKAKAAPKPPKPTKKSKTAAVAKVSRPYKKKTTKSETWDV